MTRSNLYIKLSDGSNLTCVADSSSAPEQAYIVEHLFLPLFVINGAEKEREFLAEWCALYELRANAEYRYHINLQAKRVRFFEEHYDYQTEKFRLGKELTHRYNDYIASTEALSELLKQLNF
jgi:hypothetical protein